MSTFGSQDVGQAVLITGVEVDKSQTIQRVAVFDENGNPLDLAAAASGVGGVGPAGPIGPAGPAGPAGAAGQWSQVTQAQYDALSPPDSATLYVIVG